MGENSKEKEVMDTPERSKNTQIATSIGKFEDSPTFLNFLNSLSPIQPVKSIHISQTINPFCFSSLPSIFTSPHVSSLKESRFLQRHHPQDPSKPELSSDGENTVDMNKANADNTKKLDDQKENLDPRASFECSKLVLESAENFNYGSNSSTLAPFVEGDAGRGLCRSEVNMEGVSKVDENKEATSDGWESLIDVSDFLIFESPNDTQSYQKSVDPATSFYQSIKKAIKNTQQVGEGSECENLSTQPREGSEMDDEVAGSSVMNPSESMDYELPGLYRGMRRRCLVFEMAEARRKQLEENLVSDPSMLLQSDGKISSNQQLVPISTGNDSSRRVLPGIGLHLNALATTPKAYKIVNHEASPSGRLLIGPSPSADFLPPISGQELLSNSLANSSLEIETNILSVLHVEDPMPNEEINPSSPRKKKRRIEQAGEAEACRRCNCKKSKCLKLYCECFAAGVYCVEPCACIDCFNKPIHEDTVLATRKQIESRNPLAFAPKVIRASDSEDDFSKTPASARHKRGCNCKKSGCLKKYCECYQGGVGCSINCRCEGCKNAFGRKDGMDAEIEDDETDSTEKAITDGSYQQTAIGDELQEQNFSSKNKPPRSSFPSISSSTALRTSQVSKMSNFIVPSSKFNHFETINEDEMLEFLQTGSPIGSIKSSSPNRKRVSPPQRVNLSPSLRSSRKLVLRSIPSFPSLRHDQ